MANRTPFLSGFGPLLFGRGSKFTLKKVQAIRSLESLFEMFGDFVPARFLSKETKGVNSRERESTLGPICSIYCQGWPLFVIL